MTGAVDPRLRAGAGRARIAYPPTTWPLEGFTGEHDPLYARVLVLAGTERVVLVVVDQTSLVDETIDEVRATVSKATATDASHVVVCVSHTFSAPHILARGETPDPLAARMAEARDALLGAVEAAAADAARTCRRATAAWSQDQCDVAVNRDVETREGWTIGADSRGTTDRRVLVLRIDDEAGEPIAILANVAVQPSVMSDSVESDGSRRTTGDLAGAAVEVVEETFGGRAVAFFLLGAAGDQAPVVTAVRSVQDRTGSSFRLDAGGPAHLVATLLGERLGAVIVRAALAADAEPGHPVVSLTHHELTAPGQEPLPRERIRPTRGHEFRSAPERRLPFSILRVGDGVLAGVQPELNAMTGLGIAADSPWRFTGVVTMFNGGAKYAPDARSYDRFTYEALSSRYAKGTAERLSEAIAAALADTPR
ncbi:hypothetical protein [Microbacterium sp. PRC9]|uniref:hypothetical protein n=1 Tax=Microbacterium sp. PRC9 TaxID=2962591 RepID=UPI002882A74B|nr:hypothetical protein [Microbacterium sp. PRC9]MDT0144534.1 hypothetical protein [Microbacterium sp. PRC9]